MVIWTRDLPIWKRSAIAVLASAAVVGAAVTAAAFVPAGSNGVVEGVERLSTAGSTALGYLAAVLPWGFAFGAGAVAAVNPCGFVLLPTYLGLYLGADSGAARPRGQVVLDALRVSATMSAGFVVVFGIVGGAIGLGAAQFVGILPWVGLLLGVGLAALGGLLVAGGGFSVSAGERIADRLGVMAQRSNSRGYFAYGLAYGATSLSCTLPIFLAVVVGSLVADGVLPAMLQFVFYALGMGMVITVFTLASALVRSFVVTKIRGMVQLVQPVSAGLLLLAGGYVVFYWLTLGGLFQTIQRAF